MFAKIAVILEKIAYQIKTYNSKKEYAIFLKKNNLIDCDKKAKTIRSYNSYEGSSVGLMKRLIDSKEIDKNDNIMDIGCGAGIFLSFLHKNGFVNLSGIELDDDFFLICQRNIKSLGAEKIRLYHEDALEFCFYDNINVFYLFNPFYDEGTYIKWLSQIKLSVDRMPRRIKIIVLFPTISSICAIKECGWLRKKCSIVDCNEVCSKCVKYLVFDNGE